MNGTAEQEPNIISRTDHWLIEETSLQGERCVKSHPLVGKHKIVLPPLHIKLGLTKHFVKVMHENGEDFGYL